MYQIYTAPLAVLILLHKPERKVTDMARNSFILQQKAQDISSKLPDKTLFNRLLGDPHANITEDCLTQMGYVVDYLYDNQIAFHIEQTTSGGYLQLQAVTDSPKARITLTGNGNHIDFIGSGIKANQRYAFTATPYDADGRSVAATNSSSRTYRPSRDDINSLLDAYLKNDMSAFAAPDQSRTLSFSRSKSNIPNTYYQNGKLRKSYRTIPHENGMQQDVELLIQPVQTNVEGETSTMTNSLITIGNAIKNSHDYLVEEIMQAAEFMSGKASFTGNKIKSVCDYGIDNGAIQDMAIDIKSEIENIDSDYNLMLSEASDAHEALESIVSHYVDTQVLGLSENENGEIITLPVINDRSYEASPDDVPEGFTMDPNAVSSWTSLSENESNITSIHRIQSSMRGLGMTKDNVVGEDNRNATMADSLISFNEDAAKTKDDFEPGSFERRVLEHTEKYMMDLGIKAECRFDDKGIIDVSGEAMGMLNGRQVSIPVRAQVGQIFAPDEHNVVHVMRNQNDNFLFVPGYRAFIEEDDGSGKNLMERTVLTGYYDSVCDTINNALSPLVNSTSRALGRGTPSDVSISVPTACNSVYGETYGTRLPEDYMENFIASGFDEDDVYAIYNALSGKIAYSKEMDMDATTIAAMGDGSRALEIAGQNIREMGDECLGFVYTNMTNTGRGSGTRRYLCATAKVGEDGHIIKGDENDLTSPLFSRPMFEGVNHNALDRNVMAFSQLMTAQGIDKGAKGCHVTVDGWTLDDGYVVSKDFAERHTIPDVDGNPRVLKVGDKISDMNGNKGVINIIVDPQMPDAQAKREEILPLVQIMRDNPGLDFISAPYSGMSRSNAGTAFSMMKDANDLKLPNGDTIKGGMGSLPIVITGMTVDTKTHIYDENGERHRNSSGQLSWLLSSKGLNNIAREIYGNNESGLNELRAYMNIIGVTLDEEGNLHQGFGSKSGDISRAQLVNNMSEDDGSGLMKVKKFDEYVLDTDAAHPKRKDKLHLKKSAAKWNAEAKDFNGFIQLPFPVQGADGNNLEVTVADEYGEDRIISVMPVVSAAYRSNIKHDKGETYSHDYTRNYAEIIRSAGEYMSAATRLSKLIAGEAVKQNNLPDGMTMDDLEQKLIEVYSSRSTSMKIGNKTAQLPEGFDDGCILRGNLMNYQKFINGVMGIASRNDADVKKTYDELRAEQRRAAIKGQSEYANIVNDTISKKFEDRKHGAIANCLIKVGCKHSATAVWSADPRLDIDTCKMSSDMYNKLNIKDDHLLVWRDPLLHDGGMRYMKVEIDDSLTGIAVNPLIAMSFDGDFDGDSLGAMALQTKEAHKEAMENLTVQASILNPGVGEKGNHPFRLQAGMDVAAAKYASKPIADAWDSLNAKANLEYAKDGMVSDDTFDEIKKLSKRTLQAGSYQNAMSYDSPQSVAESLVKMSKEYGNGSKGSMGKMKGFMEYLGYDVAVTPNDNGYDVDVKENPMTKEERLRRNKEVCVALGCKCDETGVAGYASQKAMRALRNICPTESLDLTYPVTQGMLDAKHDADEARTKANLTQNVIPDLWEGKAMAQDASGKWKVKHSASPAGTQSVAKSCRPSEWKDQFMRIMCQANGIDVSRDASASETKKAFSKIMNPGQLDKVANALTDENGKIVGLTAKACTSGSFIDTAIYGVPASKPGKKTMVTEYIIAEAKNNTNIFDRGGMIFAPDSIRDALKDSGVSSPEASIEDSLSYVKENENSMDMSIC